jgi:hypothetical protein
MTSLGYERSFQQEKPITDSLYVIKQLKRRDRLSNCFQPFAPALLNPEARLKEPPQIDQRESYGTTSLLKANVLMAHCDQST